MSRARTDYLDEIAIILARYLDSRRGADPNPSGHSVPPPNPAPQPLRIAHEPSTEDSLALVGDLEYSVKDAAIITHRAEPTVRKMMSDGRLPFRKVGTRSLIRGEHLAQILTEQVARSSQPTDPAAED